MALMTGDEKHALASSSTVDVLWVLYDKVLRVTPSAQDAPGRDRFLLSKGHGPMAYYAVLAAKGFVPEEWLPAWGTFDSPLGHHPDRNLVPGVEISSGSLGHGLPLAVGTALGLRAQGNDARVVVLVGDAELDEGSNHEALELAAALRLDRLTVVVIDNRSSSYTVPGRIAERFAVEGWDVATVDGRDHDELEQALTRHRRRASVRRGGDRRRRGGSGMSAVQTLHRAPRTTSPRRQFALTVTDLLDEDPRVALVYAEISGQFFGDARRAHPERVVNVGIREQLLVNVGAGMALAGLRPVVHTFGTFLAERGFEQVKLGFGHQGVGGVLVGSAGSFDVSYGGRTHQTPGDVTLMDTVPGMQIHAPGNAEEVDAILRAAVADDGLHYVRLVEQRNALVVRAGRFHVVRRGPAPRVVALGPVLDEVLDATSGRDVTVLYSSSVRPFDAAGLRAVVTGTPDVVLVEPWLAGTSARVVDEALQDLPHRLLSLGVGRVELRHYGTAEEHIAAHGLDAPGLRRSIDAFLSHSVVE